MTAGLEYDNLYVAVDGSGVWGYYWSNGEGAWRNSGARVLLSGRTGGWRLTKTVIGAGNHGGFNSNGASVFYSIDTDGGLRWHGYVGIPGSGGYWHPNSGLRIGQGWQNFAYVTAFEGIFWAVEQDGTLRWYRYDTPVNGSSVDWDSNSGAIIGSGWRGGTLGFQTVLSGGLGILYAVDRNGALRWNRHYGYGNGTISWDDDSGGGVIIGSGWM
ncbi:tachylectin-related carbohydrate-binding protein [Actinoplanes sp. NPDC023714]|uniref:tachylectin-related carbohydrate-binding protein n=1 Tax=Actinoplanes sp. NPDC023714 TaxID=3154322 RepID=UPI0033C02138